MMERGGMVVNICTPSVHKHVDLGGVFFLVQSLWFTLRIMIMLGSTNIEVYLDKPLVQKVGDVHLLGKKHQMTLIKATTQQPQLMFVFHICKPPSLCSFAM